MIDEKKIGDVMTAILAGAAGAEPKTFTAATRPYAVVPEGYRLADLERFLPAPTAKRGAAAFDARDSLIAYVETHKGFGTVLFAEAAQHRVTAVLDHHRRAPEGDEAPAPQLPAWGRHRAVLTLPLDPDWKRWCEHDDKLMEQLVFAQLVEDLLPTIKVPDGAELLELAQHLEQTVNVAFKSAERLGDGRRQLTYAEDAVTKLGNSRIELPEQFKIRCPVYFRAESVDLVAKLRVRTKGTTVLLGYHLHRPEETLERAFQDILAVVARETGITPYLGSAPACADYGGSAAGES